MAISGDLRRVLQRIDGRGYKAYKDIEGTYDFGEYTLIIDHVQGDPFAAPSRMRVLIPQRAASFPRETYDNRSREVALRDFLTRRFSESIRRFCRGGRGSGKSGLISIDRPGQEILQRTSMFVGGEGVEARFRIGLPAFGRKIAAKNAEAILFEELPRIVKYSLFFRNLDQRKLTEHVETAEDADALRAQLKSRGLIAFITEGAILPRASGIDQRPLTSGRVIPFAAPDSLRMEVNLPNRGKVKGMGIGEGVTLIVGGGYHGKSTLLRAIELGVYNYIPGDGRELVVSDPQSVKIRAEDGRRIEKVDIDPFISNLPFGKDTRSFSTDDASGSTSQAANIMEALEVGARVLLMDEDTSATNFMIRDHRMQELVAKEREPITPFIDKIRQLYRDLGVSTVLAIGGSGDYFDVAERVICMVEYRPHDLTEQALGIAAKYKAERRPEGGEQFGVVSDRTPVASSFDPSRGRREVKISSKGLFSIDFGTHRIDLGACEQLVDTSQTNAIGDAIQHATRYMDGKRTVSEVITLVMKDIGRKGLDVFSRRPLGEYALFREHELAAAMNRLRTFSVRTRFDDRQAGV
ncbi:MAG: ATPase [Spirochaetes bacterium DG_61]|nr:MAG: ATPase [Spirochaetes bacterium DG_61]